MSLPCSSAPRIVSAARPILRALLLAACAATLASVLPRAATAASPLPDEAVAAARGRLLLPLIQQGPGAATTGAFYTTIPVPPPPSDRPAVSHGDLNLALRGYIKTTKTLGLVSYGGNTDPGAPQLPGIFSDQRTPAFTSVHRVYEWNWTCGSEGCRGNPISNPEVTLLGMGTSPGELLSIPSRTSEIYGGGYSALVLYADEKRITFKYTREDNVVGGYTVHLENLSVDANLLALYRQSDAAGRGQLPGIKNGQPVGIASGNELLVAVRDCGTFLDPRSRKDWWQGR